jgi:UDP-glucose 4-epimerase
MKVFVTGGAGFIGSHTVEALVGAGHEVVVWDDLSVGKRSNLAAVAHEIRFHEGDVRDFAGLREAVRATRAEAILHLAAIASVPRSVEEPRFTHSVNLTGTLNVLEAARQEEVGRVVLACSAAIYGDEPSLPKTEAMPARPTSPYGLEKWQSEQYADLYARQFGLTTVSLRYFNVFGPGQDPRNPYSGVISIFLDRLLAGQPVVIDGDGEQTRDFVYVADVAEANRLALTVPLAGHHRFNIGRGEETSIRRLFEILGELVGRAPAPELGPARVGDVYRSFADASLAQSVLGLRARYTVAEGLERLVEWYRSAVGQTPTGRAGGHDGPRGNEVRGHDPRLARTRVRCSCARWVDHARLRGSRA